MTPKDAARVAFRPFDAAEFLDDEETIAAYVSEAFESNDPAEMAEAVGTIARARGMTEIARQAGVSRESLYRALSSKGNPELSTLVNVMRACGIRLAALPFKGSAKKPSPAKTKTRRRRHSARPKAA